MLVVQNSYFRSNSENVFKKIRFIGVEVGEGSSNIGSITKILHTREYYF